VAQTDVRQVRGNGRHARSRVVHARQSSGSPWSASGWRRPRR